MIDLKEKRREAKGKFEAVKNLVDKKKDLAKDFTKNLDESARDIANNAGKSVQGFIDKNKKKVPNLNSVFDDLIGDLEKMLKIDAKDQESVLKRITRESVNETSKKIKKITVDNVKSVLFSNDSNFGCGVSTPVPQDNMSISPSEFDFLGSLKMTPTSTMGRLLYEDGKDRNKVKMNKELFNSFDSASPYTFTSGSGNDLFTTTWNASTQKYDITDLKGIGGNQTVDEFITQYYETIEFPNPSDLINSTVAMMLPGDGSETTDFNVNMNSINRILKKVMSACGKPNKDNELKQTAVDQFDENEVEPEFYFDFDDVDGIDLDDESLRYKRVLKFTDCNNFEVPIKPNHIRDFVYVSRKKDPTDALNSTLNKIAKDANNLSQGSIPLQNFNLSLNLNALKTLPKALLSSIFSPKIFLPLIILWKQLKAASISAFISVKQLVKNFSKLLYNIMQDLFFQFITTFWKKVKPELVKLITSLVPIIFKNSKKRYIFIIKNLIKVISFAIPFIGIKNCSDLYDQVLKLFDLLRVGAKQNISGFLLNGAKFSPGYSNDRATINITQYLESSGIQTGDLFGQPNNVTAFVSSLLKGHQDEMDANSSVQISLDFASIPVAPGGGAALINPLIKGYGKLI